MKLISLVILALNLAVDCRAHEHFTFPPQYQTPHPGIYSHDKSPFLPPESHTPIPYYQLKNINNLPYPFLPPSGTKAPMGFPTPLPIMISSTFMPIRSDEGDDSDENNKSTSQMPPHLRKFNRTDRNPNQMATRREFRQVSQSIHQPIDRIDTKGPFQFSFSTEQPMQNTVVPRSIVISDIQRNDQIKAGSYQSPQYVPQPGVFISSTTETAIPILRLSNEMDLDGSFSYEALGADQTHYVQHSRMENMGAGKEEQVVEGSYSYVGSDGKTYTTHYIADSNGFRAIGDHLPVPPPIPEIIQRSIQYNLAEEAKKPPQFKSWIEEEKENDISESERRQHVAISPPRINHLFTGKTPESFSHSFSKASNTQNNLVAAASNQTPIQTTIDFTPDQIQSKANSGTISPQITFLASQGAHVPSANTPQQTIARIFTTEKSTMPQLINYEANIKDSDQESNKALWRWQYGLNANANQNDKNSISRSSGNDDIIINFDDMTPDQYTTMIKQEMEPNMRENIEASQKDTEIKATQYPEQYSQYNIPTNFQYQNNYLKHNQEKERNNVTTYPTEKTVIATQDRHILDSGRYYDYNSNDDLRQAEFSQTSRPKLITQQQFIPPSQTVSKSYDYAEDEFESRRTKVMNSNSENISDMKLNVLPLKYDQTFPSSLKTETNQLENAVKVAVTQNPLTTATNLKFTDFIINESKDEFKPLFKFTEPQVEETTTTETSLEEILTENIFLKNILRNNKNEQQTSNKINEDSKDFLVKPIIETNADIYPKYLQHHQPKMYSTENKTFKRNPIDMVEMLNFVTKNQFESNKIRPRPKQNIASYQQKNEMYYFTPEDGQEDEPEENTRKLRTIQQNGELRGVIKNYKVLQRNSNLDNEERINFEKFRKNLRPPTFNLPPLGRAGPSAKSYLPPVYV